MSYHRLIFFLVIAAALAGASCEVNIITEDPAPPATPSGLYAWNYDGKVKLTWDPNEEGDLAGYGIWVNDESYGSYEWIADVEAEYGEYTEYKDYDVVNGTEYYYTVTAFDTDLNESEPASYVYTTPRPEGWVKIYDGVWYPDKAGFDFSTGTVTEWDEGDIYLVYDWWGNPEIYPADGVWLLDFDSDSHLTIDDAQDAPIFSMNDYMDEGIACYEQSIYIVYISTDESSGHYAKFRIIDLDSGSWIAMDWAYQEDPDNPDL